ncbi:MAG: hypothetical protein AAFX06_28695 [Planctomycetota bacterium]
MEDKRKGGDFLDKEVTALRQVFSDHPKIADEAVSSLESAWNSYSREAAWYIARLETDGITALPQIEEHYREKERYLGAELGHLKSLHRFEAKKARAEVGIELEDGMLDYFRDQRRRGVDAAANPDFPSLSMALSPELTKKLSAIRNAGAEQKIKNSKKHIIGVRRAIRSHTWRRWKRRAWEFCVSRFWGFIVVTLIVEQAVQYQFSQTLKLFANPVVRTLVLVSFLFACYQLKVRYLDPWLRSKEESLRTRNARQDAIDAAISQTRLSFVYIVEKSLEDLKREIVAQIATENDVTESH